MGAEAVEVIDARPMLRDWQAEVADNLARFNVLLVARRSGKTVLSCLWLLSKALETDGCVCVYIAPKRSQAERIAAGIIEQNMPPGATFNKSSLLFTMPNGSRLYMLGTDSDNGDSIRGLGIRAACLDEVADISPYAFTQVVRPALADHNGELIAIGTPRGKVGLFYRLWQQAKDTEGWYRAKFDVYEAKSLPDDEIEQLRQEMSEAEFGSEMMVDWQAEIKGAYYSRLMNQADREGRITSVPLDPALPIYCSMDLGYSDATSIWITQVSPGGEIRHLAAQEWQNTALPEIVRDIRERWDVDTWICPHDIKVRELGSGRSREGIMRELGCNVKVAPNQHVRDGIEAVRTILPKCWFDEAGCGDSIDYLRAYRAEWDEKRDVARLQPLHDFTSHSADAMRMFAVTYKDGLGRYKPRDLSHARRRAARTPTYA